MSLVDDTVSAKGAVAITTNDSTDLGRGVARGLYVAVSGDVKVTMENGDVVTYTALAGGVVHPFYVKRVWATGTTATGLVALY